MLELKNTITKTENLLDGINSGMERTEERINKPASRTIEISRSEQHGENGLKNNEQSLRELWNSQKALTVLSTKPQKEQKKIMGAQNIFKEIIAEKFSSWAKETYRFKKLS